MGHSAKNLKIFPPINFFNFCQKNVGHWVVSNQNFDNPTFLVRTSLVSNKRFHHTEKLLSVQGLNITDPNALCNLAYVMNSLVVFDFNSAVF